MGIIDKTIEKINPEIALKRKIAREKLKQLTLIQNKGYGEHGASVVKKSLKGWQTFLGGHKTDINQYRDKLVARSRDLYMGAPIARGSINTMITNVIGSGLKLKSSIDIDTLNIYGIELNSEKELENLETKIEKEFNLWADSKIEQIGLMNFYEIQELVFLTTLLNGECFVHFSRFQTHDNPYLLKLNIIEPDRISTPMSKLNDKSVIDGVQLDKNNRIEGYYIQEENPNDNPSGKNNHKLVPIYGNEGQLNILHLINIERPGQVKGVPFLSPVMESLKQLDRYTDAELMSAVISSMLTIFIQTTNDDGVEVGEIESDIPENQRVTSPEENNLELGNGAIVGLNPGETANAVNPARPNVSFDPFMTAILRQIGSALGVPYELLVMHFTSSYSASRAALLEAWKTFRKRREWIAKNFCQVVYEEWLKEAVLLGRLDIKDFEKDVLIKKAYSSAIWNGPSQGQLDPLKEVNAAILRVDHGLSTRTKETAELNGGDFEQNIRILARENNILNEKGVMLNGSIFETSTDDTGNG